MSSQREVAAATAIIALACTSMSLATDLSPGSWPKAERESLEALEGQGWSPTAPRVVEGGRGIVSATVSPLSVYVGIQTLKLGGNAADAAAATALTQVTMQLGSVVSYAGIFTMLYYDAKERRVYSMDAGYNSYLQETDPKSIPVGNLGPLPMANAPKPTEGGAKGRETLVPGFMAGVDALHGRFGRLPLKDLFQPAIWYAENGIRISPTLQYFFTVRGRFLARTPEGRDFIRQSGSDKPKSGDLFVQPGLATTLRAVAEKGSGYMYTGPWADEFVRTVQREGGKVTAEDMKRYRPIWSEPRKAIVFGHTVFVNGPPHLGGQALITGLNLAETLELDKKGPYWSDPETFQALARISPVASVAPRIGMRAKQLLLDQGIDISEDAQLGKPYARALAPLLGTIFTQPAGADPKHSNAIVVVDKDGNIAAVTHTINSVIWGDTGIVVGGIPIPDSASFQQLVLASMAPGERVPHQIIDTIAFEGDKPVLAAGSIGSSLIPESIRVLVGVLGQHESLEALTKAPPLLSSLGMNVIERPAWQLPVQVPQGAYSAEFIRKLIALGLNLNEVPEATAGAIRGTLAAVSIDPATEKRTAVDQPGLYVFNRAE